MICRTLQLVNNELKINLKVIIDRYQSIEFVPSLSSYPVYKKSETSRTLSDRVICWTCSHYTNSYVSFHFISVAAAAVLRLFFPPLSFFVFYFLLSLTAAAGFTWTVNFYRELVEILNKKINLKSSAPRHESIYLILLYI